MIGSILQTCRVVVDPLVWEVLLIILGITVVFTTRLIAYALT